jgi:hypothetical protein
LGGVTALFASGLVMDDAEAATPGPSSPDDVEPWLASLDQDLTRMRARLPPTMVREGLAEAGLSTTLMGETFAALSLVAAWRDSDEEVRQHPAFQARLFACADQVARSSAVMVSWLERAPRAHRRILGALLVRPNRLMALLDRVFMQKGAKMNPVRRRALRGTLGELARAARKTGTKPESLVDDLIGFVDHAARAEGVDRHALAAESSAAASETPTAETKTLTREKWRMDTPDGKVRLGLCLLGLAVLISAGGVLIFALSVALFSVMLPVFTLFTGVLCFVIGPLLLLSGLLLLIIGLIGRRREGKASEEEVLLYLLDPEDPLSPLPA